MENIKQNVQNVRERIISAATRVGRNPNDIMLCAACKTQTPNVISQSANYGIDIFGENRVQELVKNYSEDAYKNKPLHFIGHLQTNKVKMLVGKCNVIESVDSAHLADAINKEAKKQNLVQKIMLEVNIGGEESKSGVSADDLFSLLDYVKTLENLKVVGLMTIPPKSENVREYFKKMRTLFEKAKEYSNFQGKYLSMGMSGDFEIAIEEGANIVRVGTAIYGQREYK
jgi:pyridoxal phosphate enzyme (YggS family)